MDLLPGDLMSELGLWLGLLLSLAIFSAVAGDNVFARLAQHLLVGAAVGYAALLAWQHVLRPRLLSPLLAGGAPFERWLVAALCLLLVAGGLERIVAQHAAPAAPGPARSALRFLAAFPAALLLGLSVAVALLGVLQGSLLPQALDTVRRGLDFGAPPAAFTAGALALLLATGALLALRVDPGRDLAGQPAPVRRLMLAWLWLGRRGLWFAAGILFARLAVARFSLLISRMDYFLDQFNRTGVWQWAEQLWRRLGGG